MECCCEQNNTDELKIEGDLSSDPFWCSRCGCNLDIDEISLSAELKEELSEWMANYGSWINWNTDKLVPNGIALEDKHNKQGVKLAAKAKKELAGKYKIRFLPSTSARMYARFDR